MKKPKFADLGDFPEAKRIYAIGVHAMLGNVVAFIVEDNAKADRYMKQLIEQFPEVIELDRVPGPVHGSVTVKVGRPQTDN